MHCLLGGIKVVASSSLGNDNPSQTLGRLPGTISAESQHLQLVSRSRSEKGGSTL
jgi:hypothetical protein